MNGTSSNTATISGEVSPALAGLGVRMPRPGRGGRAMGAGGADDEAVVEPMSVRVVRWVTRASVVGLALSAIVHLIFLMVSGVITWPSGGGGGSGGEPTGPIELAVITARELSAAENAPVSVLAPGVDEPTPDATASSLSMTPSAETPGGQATPGSSDLGGIGAGLGGSGNGTGDGLGDGPGGGAGGGGAKFFGVEARGERFVYVVDISGSMNEMRADGPPKIEGLKSELTRSLEGLGEGAMFLVIPFETDSRPLLNRERWFDASDRNKKVAIEAIRQLIAGGGTNPQTAFTTAFTVKPRPDAIYFMTDGLFDEGILTRVAMMNRGEPKIPIHCIAFGDNAAVDLLKRMAAESGGKFSKVEGP